MLYHSIQQMLSFSVLCFQTTSTELPRSSPGTLGDKLVASNEFKGHNVSFNSSMIKLFSRRRRQVSELAISHMHPFSLGNGDSEVVAHLYAQSQIGRSACVDGETVDILDNLKLTDIITTHLHSQGTNLFSKITDSITNAIKSLNDAGNLIDYGRVVLFCAWFLNPLFIYYNLPLTVHIFERIRNVIHKLHEDTMLGVRTF